MVIDLWVEQQEISWMGWHTVDCLR